MGGQHLTIACMLSTNGTSVASRALIDSGANGFIFVNTLFAIDLVRSFNITAARLPSPIQVKGYNGKPGKPVTHYIRLHLTVDQRRQYNVPLLILDLGSHDIIIGRKWLAYFDVLPDCRRRCLVWPAKLPPSYSVAKEIRWNRQDLIPALKVLSHQEDADRRDRAFATDQETDSGYESAEVAPICPGSQVKSTPQLKPKQKLQPRVSFKLELQDCLQRMNDNLLDQQRAPDLPYRKKPYQPTKARRPYQIDINAISANGFRLHLRQEDSELFSTSLYEIDRLIQDRKDQSLRDSGGQTTDLCQISQSESAILQEPQFPAAYRGFQDVFSKEASDTLPPNRLYDHRIDLIEPNNLGFGPLYRMTTEELEEVKRYLIENLNKGFIEPSQAPFAAPILFVRKADGRLRLCIDFRNLNQITRKDRYPLPLIDELLGRISRAKILTKLDIRQAFNRIRMSPESEELTTFRTRYGSYKCKVLPFGLTNGPATYQRYMNDVLFDYLDDFCTAYLDDILIYSENELDHEEHVKKVLQRLRDAGLQADLKKCEFGVKRTKYLGFIITTDGIEVDPEKVSAVVNWTAPTTVKGVQSFLGFCNFYRRFIQDYGRIAKPLIQLTKTDVPFVFDKLCWEAFEELKLRLTSAPVLHHYSPEYESMIETDASDGVIAGVLSQLHPDKEWYPVAYFSKTMAPAECNYEIHDKEMLAIVRSLAEWRPEL
jgi:Reverse transcriptase (RNA-dependent DNA polymerase)/RNase H-like domain found in reverse transcriptase/Retroviral aspartyl protease